MKDSIVKIIKLGIGALARAIMAWIIVFGAIGGFTSVNEEIAVEFAFIASFVVFVAYMVFDPMWGAPVEH